MLLLQGSRQTVVFQFHFITFLYYFYVDAAGVVVGYVFSLVYGLMLML